jgi:hypothetical protein
MLMNLITSMYVQYFQTKADNNTLRVGKTLSYGKLHISSDLTRNNLGIYKGTFNMTEMYKELLLGLKNILIVLLIIILLCSY